MLASLARTDVYLGRALPHLAEGEVQQPAVRCAQDRDIMEVARVVTKGDTSHVPWPKPPRGWDRVDQIHNGPGHVHQSDRNVARLEDLIPSVTFGRRRCAE